MSVHANGSQPAVPDIAGDLERTTAVVKRLAARLRVLGDASGVLYDAVATRLGASTDGTAVGHVVDAALETAHGLVDEHIVAASEDLSRTTGIPAAALRTRAGWDAALKDDGHDDNVECIDDLPGTATVLGVRELVELTDLRCDLRSTRTYEKLRALWDTTRGSGRTYDEIVASARHHDHVARIGWALIALEGRRHVNLIWHQANKLQRSYPDREASELLSWGWLGLRTALRNYNPALGFAFSTYAVTRIVGAIRDGVRSENPVPKRLATLARSVATAENELAQSLGRPATLEEVRAHLNLEAAQMQLVRRTRTPASIEEIVSGIDRSGGREPDWMANGDDTGASALSLLDADTIARAVGELPDEDAEAIRLLILEERTPTEARRIARVTARQLRQRKERGLAALRERLKDLDPYA